MELLYIHWNPDPILFSIAGIAIRWYSIFWFIAILAGSQVVYKLYQSKGLPVDTFQNLFLSGHGWDIVCFMSLTIT